MTNIRVIGATDKVTKTGKPYKFLEVECDGEMRKVSMWSNFPDFANIKEGSNFQGTMTKEGQYWNLSYDGEKTRPGASQGFKTAQIEKVMDVKRQDISKFQDNKELSIKIASTMRMAVDIATSMKPEQWQGTTMQEEIRFWREWCWTEWDKTGSDNLPPF